MATLNPQSLVTLWQIEQYGSFSATAKATGWSQPAISQQIKKLEAAANQPESTPTPQPTSALTPGDGSGSGSETGSNARTGIAVESVGMVAGITLFVIGICLAGALGIQRRRKS